MIGRGRDKAITQVTPELIDIRHILSEGSHGLQLIPFSDVVVEILHQDSFSNIVPAREVLCGNGIDCLHKGVKCGVLSFGVGDEQILV